VSSIVNQASSNYSSNTDRSQTTTSNSQEESNQSALNFHYHGSPVSALDHSGVEDVLTKNRSHVGKMVEGLLRSGHLDPKKFFR